MDPTTKWAADRIPPVVGISTYRVRSVRGLVVTLLDNSSCGAASNFVVPPRSRLKVPSLSGV